MQISLSLPAVFRPPLLTGAIAVLLAALPAHAQMHPMKTKGQLPFPPPVVRSPQLNLPVSGFGHLSKKQLQTYEQQALLAEQSLRAYYSNPWNRFANYLAWSNYSWMSPYQSVNPYGLNPYYYQNYVAPYSYYSPYGGFPYGGYYSQPYGGYYAQGGFGQYAPGGYGGGGSQVPSAPPQQNMQPMQPPALTAPPQPADPSVARVSIYDDSFEPSSLTIGAGTAVEWKNYGQRVHGLYQPDRDWQPQNLSSGKSFSWTFTEPGTYTVIDPLHRDSMRLTIVVK